MVAGTDCQRARRVDVKRGGVASQEVGNAGETHGTHVSAEIVVLEVSDFASVFQRVPATQHAERVRSDVNGVAAALRKARRPADIERTRNADLRNPDRRADAVVDSQVGRVELRDGREGDVDPVESQAKLIHNLWSEEVSLVQSKELAVTRPRISKAGQVVELQDRLYALVLLVGVIAVEGVLIRDFVHHIARPLIDGDRG